MTHDRRRLHLGERRPLEALFLNATTPRKQRRLAKTILLAAREAFGHDLPPAKRSTIPADQEFWPAAERQALADDLEAAETRDEQIAFAQRALLAAHRVSGRERARRREPARQAPLPFPGAAAGGGAGRTPD